MKGLIAIVHCELKARWQIFLAVAVLGLLPPISPWLTSYQNLDPTDLRNASAMVLSILVTSVGALGLGSQLIIGKQAEGRLGFFLARPISGWALWFGQLAAAMLTLMISWCLMWIPTIFFGGSPRAFIDAGSTFGVGRLPHSVPWDLPQPFSVVARWGTPLPGPLGSVSSWALFWWVGACLMLLLFSHWLSMIVRLRTRWILLDVVLLATSLMVCAQAFAELYRQIAFRELIFGVTGLTLSMVLVAILAGGWQAAHGGVMASRSHAVFSVVFWSTLAVVLLLMTSYLRWMTSRGPEDLKSFENLAGAPTGEWIVVSGRLWHEGTYEPVFAYHRASAEHHFLGPRFAMRAAPLFSRQGNVLVWSSCSLDKPTCDIKWLELDGDRRHASMPLRREDLALFGPRQGRGLALSDDGRRLAVAFKGRLEVYDMPSQKLLAARRLDSVYRVELDFESSDRLRVYQQHLSPSKRHLEVWRLDIAHDQWTQQALLPGILEASHRQGDRLLISGRDEGLKLFDLWGHEEKGHLQKSLPSFRESSSILSTGHVIIVEAERAAQNSILVYDSSGRFVRDIALEFGEEVLLGAEIEAGQLLVGLRRAAPPRTSRSDKIAAWLPGLGSFSRWRTHVFDVEEGLSDAVWPGHLPAWQPTETFEQGRLLLSANGVESLRWSSAPTLQPVLPLDER